MTAMYNGYYYGFDMTYLVLVVPALLIALIAQLQVKSAFSRYAGVRCTSGLTGAQAAQRILQANGITDVRIEHISGKLTDHFDPQAKVIRLSDEVYGVASIAAVGVAAHEAGHAFAAYLNRDRVPTETIWPSLEGCEVHSMSMEFFAWPWADGFFGDDTRKFRYSHLAGALTFIPYGTMVDHFQHIVYEKPGMTPAERHAVWKELLGVYMPWMKLGSEIPFYGDGEGWQRQLHIYVNPFYYIDYCLAQTVALQFWARIQKDLPDAWAHYMAYTRQGGSRVFTELLKNAELDSPFEESCLRGVCEEAKAWLDSYDLTGIA